jgi:PAS domain-containing protein
MTAPAAIHDMIVTALANSDAVVAAIRPEGEGGRPRLAWSNAAAVRLLGFDPMAEPRRAEALLFGAGGLRAAALAAAFAGEARNEDIRFRAPDGSLRTLGARLMPAEDPAGGRCLVLLGRDLSARRQRSTAEQRARILLLTAVSAAAVPVFVCGTDGRIGWANPQLGTLLGQEPADLADIDFASLVHAGDRLRLQTATSSQDRDGEPFELALRLLPAAGGDVLVRLHGRLCDRAETGRIRVFTAIPDTGHSGAPADGPLMLATRIELGGLAARGEELSSDLLARAADATEAVLRRAAPPPDSWSRTGPTKFLACLGGETQEAIAYRAAALADEIRRELLVLADRPGAEAVSVVTDLQPLSAGDLSAPELLARRLEDRLGTLRREREAEARRVIATAMDTLTCEALRVVGRGGRDAGMRLLELEPAGWRRVAVAVASLPAEEVEGVDRSALRFSLAAPMLAAATEARLWLLPVSFEAFEPKSRALRTLETMRGLLPPPPGRIVPVLSDIPAAAGNWRIGDLLRQLRGLGAGVGVAATSLEQLPFDLQDRTATMVLGEAAMLAESLARRPRATAQAIQRITAHGARVLAVGPADAAQSALLLDGGCEFVTADAT